APTSRRRLSPPLQILFVHSCLWESDTSTRCMDENDHEREGCSTYFLKYKTARTSGILSQSREDRME
uniref:Uncharacterized protein n=1 Tax=Equus asinus asinus TaxID=83772 RepID=A0A8C4PKS6_EQUAS